MAKAKYFTQNKEKIYPISHIKAVYDGKGKVLEDRLTEDETAISSLQTDVKGKADKTDVDYCGFHRSFCKGKYRFK